MKIQKAKLENFMLFDSLELEFSKGINVIFGENSTGKTALLKVLYSASKVFSEAEKNKNGKSAANLKKSFISKAVNVFRCENNSIGRLVGRKQRCSRTDARIEFDNSCSMEFGFSRNNINNIQMLCNYESIPEFTPIFIPPKEIISSTGNFVSLYDDYHIEFDETYYDLARLLLRPLRKGAYSSEQKKLLSVFEKLLNGSVVQKENRFYLKVKGSGEFEMGLVSEGYRKLSTMIYLIQSGVLNDQSVLFWDEPESNMNPKMIHFMTQALLALAKMGVQIFVTTHSYFVQQAFNLAACYPNSDKDKAEVKFLSLFKEPSEENRNHIGFETGATLDDISHNAIMEEFDALYSRELRLRENE